PRRYGAPAHRRGPVCPPDRACRRAGRIGSPAQPSPCRTASPAGSGAFQVVPGSSPITSPRRPAKRARSQDPSLHRHYPASQVHCPCPPPRPAARPAAVGAVPPPSGISPVARNTFPACRPHYPGGLDRCSRRSLPWPCCLPGLSRRSASATPLSRLAQGLHSLRPAELLDRPRRPLSRGFERPSRPGHSLASYQIDRQLSGWILLPLVFHAFVAHGEGWGEGGCNGKRAFPVAICRAARPPHPDPLPRSGGEGEGCRRAARALEKAVSGKLTAPPQDGASRSTVRRRAN